MNSNEGMAVIEAILFACADPISIDKLSSASQIDTETTAKLVEQLQRRYNVSESGLEIIRLDDGFQIATRAEYAPYIKSALENKRQQPLSQAAMETLAVIAYNQPVTKAFVEQVRGIDSSSVVNTLVERGLLEEAGRLELPGRPVSFRTTDTFLRCFHLTSLRDLPPLPNQEGQLEFEELKNIPESQHAEEIEIVPDNEIPKDYLSDEEMRELEEIGLEEPDNPKLAYTE